MGTRPEGVPHPPKVGKRRAGGGFDTRGGRTRRDNRLVLSRLHNRTADDAGVTRRVR